MPPLRQFGGAIDQLKKLKWLPQVPVGELPGMKKRRWLLRQPESELFTGKPQLRTKYILQCDNNMSNLTLPASRN